MGSISTPALANLIQRLRLHKPQQDDDAGKAEDAGSVVGDGFKPKRAAVLICLFEDELGQIRVILTKRSSNLSAHSGEVALPGGKAEEGDADDRATALREANEEIGLDPSLVTVAAVLEPILTRHPLRVVPVIGVLSDRKAYKPVVNTAEVETIFEAPLEMFLKNENRRSQEREWMGTKYLLHYFDFETENRQFLIWGLTARILIRAASVVYQQPPSFPVLNPKFNLSQLATLKNNQKR